MLPKLSSNWSTCELQENCKIIMGQAPKSSTYNQEKIGLPLIAGAADFGKKTPSPKKWTDKPTKLGKKGDIILCVRATIGDLNWADEIYCYGRGVGGIRVNNNYEPEFIWYWLEACKEHLLSLGRGATFKQINKTDIAALPVPKIDVAEQRRIVRWVKDCISRVEEIGELRNKSLHERQYLLSSLIESTLSDVEGEEVTLNDACSITSKLIDPRKSKYANLLHVGGANIEAETGILVNMQTAVEENLKSGKFTFDESMVLYNKIRPYLMKVARPTFSGLCSADMYPLKPNEEILSKNYLFFLLMSRRFTDYAIAGSNRAGMPKVNRNHLFAYTFNLPPLDVQNSVCEKLDEAYLAINDLRRELSESPNEISALRDSILHRAFAGEL